VSFAGGGQLKKTEKNNLKTNVSSPLKLKELQNKRVCIQGRGGGRRSDILFATGSKECYKECGLYSI